MKVARILKLATKAVRRTDQSSAMSEADKARDSGDPLRAIELYGQVTPAQRHYRAALVQRGNLQKDLALFDDARESYAKAWAMDGGDADLALQHGRLSRLSGRLDEAVVWYRRALEIEPGNVHASGELSDIDRLTLDNMGAFQGTWSVSPQHSLKVLERVAKGSARAGLLDFDFYRDRYSSSKTDAEILDEFARCSSYNGRSYSARLDVTGYILSNRDLDTDRTNATEHFRQHSAQEGRSVAARYRDFSLVSQAALPRPEEVPVVGPVKIAIHLHVFYADFIPRFRRYLSRFPVPFTLLVSKSEGISDTDLAPLASLENLKAMIVKPASNRGRNFGPMLVDFRREIAGMDLCCHLHSKKSLHSGMEQVGWAAYQIEHLVGDPHLVRQHLASFAGNNQASMIAPVPFWKAPYWASHWLQNASVGTDFLAKLGIAGHDGFLTYPVGGMFWFRPSSFPKLLDLDWNYEDFPEEAGQIDGTLQHALERAMAVVGRTDGGRVLFYEPWTNLYGDDSYDILAEYSKEGPNVILTAAAAQKVVSFDVFDTVLYRDSLDKEIGKRGVARHLASLGHDAVANEFISNRNVAEFQLRKEMKFIGDVTLDETYERLARDEQLAGLKWQDLVEMEFACDLYDQRPRPAVVQIINELIADGRKVIFVSDTYYSSRHLRQMLNQAGVSRSEFIFASSEMKQRKDTGRIWHQVADRLGIKLEDLFHLGDNVVSDVQKPGDLRIRNRLILSLIDKASYLLGLNLNDDAILQQALREGLKPTIIGAGKNPFFRH